MNYDENMLIEYISYLSRTVYDVDPNFDGYVRFDPKKCQANKRLSIEQQRTAMIGLKKAGLIDWHKDNRECYVKLLQQHSTAYKPRSEEERRWINLAHHVPTYQHGYSLQDYLIAADRKGE